MSNNNNNGQRGLPLPPKRKPLVVPKASPIQQQQQQQAQIFPNILATTPPNSNHNHAFAAATSANATTTLPQNPLLPAVGVATHLASTAAAVVAAAAAAAGSPAAQYHLAAPGAALAAGFQAGGGGAVLHHHPQASSSSPSAAAARTPTPAAANSNTRTTPTTTNHQHHNRRLHHHPSTTPAAGGSTSSSNFFQGWKLRSGKWLEEEEQYAELLIDMFDQGLLGADCMTGSTLRAYLATKLHCAPMRISKKFAGKGIGKKVYSCRMDSSTGSNGNRKGGISATVAEQRRKLQQKCAEVEKAFHEAASCDAQPEMQASAAAMVTNFVPMITPAGMQFAVPNMAAAAQHFFPQMAAAQNGGGFLNIVPQQQHQGTNLLFPNHHQQQQQALQQQSSLVPLVANKNTAAGTATSAAAAATLPKTAATPGAAAPKALNNMAQLQQSYMKALSGQPTMSMVTTVGAPIANNNAKTSSTVQAAAAPTVLAPPPQSTVGNGGTTSAGAGRTQTTTTSLGMSHFQHQPQATTIANPSGNLLSSLGSAANSTPPGVEFMTATGPKSGANATQTMVPQGNNNRAALGAVVVPAPPAQGNKNHNSTTLQATSASSSSSHVPQLQSVASRVAPPNPTVAATTTTTTTEVDPTTAIMSMEPANFPDFMAGFDKVALSMKPIQVSTTGEQSNPLECSPPMTSRSFDEFHRLLGKDLTPLDGGAASAAPIENPTHEASTTPGDDSNSKSDKVLLDTTALFTAESYAMFAQESALAASQHAAYLTQSSDKVPGRNHRLGSFDFDSTMKQVAQHVPVPPRGDPAPAMKQPVVNKPKASFATVFPMQPSTKERHQIENSLTMTVATATKPPVETGKSTPVVSGSEPTSSAAESSFKGSTSESNGSDNTFSNSDDGHFESGDESNTSDEFSYDTAGGSNHKIKPDDSFSPSHFDETSFDDFQDNTGRNRRHKKRKLSLGSS